MEEKNKENFQGPRCFYCGSECFWNASFPGDEYGCVNPMELGDGTLLEPEDQIVEEWTCPNCGSEYTILQGPGLFSGNKEENPDNESPEAEK